MGTELCRGCGRIFPPLYDGDFCPVCASQNAGDDVVRRDLNALGMFMYEEVDEARGIEILTAVVGALSDGMLEDIQDEVYGEFEAEGYTDEDIDRIIAKATDR